MKKLFLALSIITIYTLPNTAHSKQAEGFSEFLQQISREAQQKGIRNETITKALAATKFVPEAIKLDKSQPEFRKNFYAYRSKVINQTRVNKARAELAKNYKALSQVEKYFGVEKEFIVALWAIESNFGENMGGYFLPSVLATLAFEGRRHDFFKTELFNALKILDQGHISQANFVGSWAGAMGQCQFMPSSFLSFAADGDNDGRKDIWRNKNDVFASAANYLSQKGWQKNQPYGRVVLLPNNFSYRNLTPEKTFTVAQLNKMGVREFNGEKLKGAKNQTASIIDLTISDTGANAGEKRYLIIFNNYKTILKWNKSSYFATSVGILAELIKQ
jgi:membrane-bound lytic murein transglycosylase B